MSSVKEFNPIPNPYIVGNPIKNAEMFYGRQDDFEFTKRKIKYGDRNYVLVLCGERRSGKTSILLQILAGKLGDKFLPFLIDMQTMAGLNSDGEFLQEMMQEICRILQDDRIDMHDYTFHGVNDNPYKTFKALLAKILLLYPEKHLVFMIDEYEMLEQKFEEGNLNPEIINFFAGLLEGERCLSFIFTGSTALEQRKNIDYWRVLFGKSIYRRISLLSRDETTRLIAEPVRRWVTYDDNAIDAIYHLTAGQPFYTQVVCQNLIDHLNECRKNYVEPADVSAVTEEILRNPLPQMIYIWNRLAPLEKLAMAVLADLQQPKDGFVAMAKITRFLQQKKSGLPAGRNEMTMALESLCMQELVIKKEESYRIQIELLRQWIRQEHSFWRIVQEIFPSQFTTRLETVGLTQPPERRSSKMPYIMAIAAVIVLGGVFVKNWIFKTPNQIEKKSAAAPPPVSLPAREDSAQLFPSAEDKARAERAQTKMRAMKKHADELAAFPVAKDVYQAASTKEEEANNAWAQGRYQEAAGFFDEAAGFYDQAATQAASMTTQKQPAPAKTVLPYTSEDERLVNAARDSVIEKKIAAKAALAENYAKEDFRKGLELEAEGDRARESRNFAPAKSSYENAIGYFERAKTHSTEMAGLTLEIDSFKKKIASSKTEIVVTAAEQEVKRGEDALNTGNLAEALDHYKKAYNFHLSRVNLINALAFVPIKGDLFTIGYSAGRPDEQPPFEIRVNDFQMSKYEATNANYAIFLNSEGNQIEGQSPWLDLTKPDCRIEKVGDSFRARPGFENYPVVYVTWFGAKAFCRWVGGRLPTEAEWEYACRMGKPVQYFLGNDPQLLADFAWHKGANGGQAHPVGRKLANDFGLHDLLGNVWEWCADWYDPKYYARKVVDNPQGPSQGEYRVLRGGAFNSDAKECRSSVRSPLIPFDRYNFVGFRVVRESK